MNRRANPCEIQDDVTHWRKAKATPVTRNAFGQPSFPKPVIVDVDDTLVLWNISEYPDLPRITVSYGGHSGTELAVHQKNVNLVEKFARLGYDVLVMSKTGADWARLICEKIRTTRGKQLAAFVAAYGGKPDFHVDDRHLGTQSHQVWRDPETGEDVRFETIAK